MWRLKCKRNIKRGVVVGVSGREYPILDGIAEITEWGDVRALLQVWEGKLWELWQEEKKLAQAEAEAAKKEKPAEEAKPKPKLIYCQALTKTGKPCKRLAKKGTFYCWKHQYWQPPA